MSRFVSAIASAYSRLATAQTVGQVAQAVRLNRIEIVHSIVAPIAGAVGGVAGRELGYATERQVTNWIPDPSATIKAYWAGQLGLAAASEILSNHGISFANANDVTGNKWTYYWDSIINSQRPRLGVQTALDLWRQNELTSEACRTLLGFHGLTYPGDRELLMRNRGWWDLGAAADFWAQGLLSDVEYGQAMDRAGIGEVDARNLLLTQRGVPPLGVVQLWWSSGRITDQAMLDRLARDHIIEERDTGLFLQSYERLSLEQAIDQWRQGRFTEAQVQEVANLQGIRPAVLRQLLQLDSSLTVSQAIDWSWRGGDPTGSELSAALSAAGITDQQRRRTSIKAQHPLPTLLQTANMARRGAFDEDQAARWKLDEGVPQQYRDLEIWVGAQWHPEPLAGAGGNAPWPTLGTAEWRSSAEIITPDEAIEASIRFAPGQERRFRAIVPNLQPFTAADLAAVYRAHGFSPVMAQWHRALRVPEVPFRTILQLYYLKPETLPRVRARLLRIGYLPSDVDELIELTDARRDYRDGAWNRRKIDGAKEDRFTALRYGYETGYYSAEQALAGLLSFRIGPPDNVNIVESWRAKVTQQHVTEMLRTMRRGFMAGEFSAGEASSGLLALGLQPFAVVQTMAEWGQARTWTRRAAATGDILRWVSTGFLTAAVGAARLANLGWTAPDIAIQLAEANERHSKLDAAANAAQQREKRKAQQELIRANKEHEKAIKDNQAALRRLTPLADLKAWLRDGTASESWIAERLALLGYPETEIPAMLHSWEHGLKQPTEPPLLVTAADQVPVFVPSPPPPPPSTTIK